MIAIVPPFTPETLARRWGCSAKHIRNMVASGALRSFRLGGKLLRIPVDAVEEVECRICQATASDGSKAASSSSGSTPPDGDTVIVLTPQLREKHSSKPPESTPL